MGWTEEVGLVLIIWVWPKVNGGLVLIIWVWPKVNGGLVLIGWVGPKVNEFDLRNGFGPNRLD